MELEVTNKAITTAFDVMCTWYIKNWSKLVCQFKLEYFKLLKYASGPVVNVLVGYCLSH